MPYVIKGDNITEVDVVCEYCLVRVRNNDLVSDEFIVIKEEIFETLDEAKIKLKSVLHDRVSELQFAINSLNSKIQEIDTKEMKKI